jgi:hypothetical protein
VSSRPCRTSAHPGDMSFAPHHHVRDIYWTCANWKDALLAHRTEGRVAEQKCVNAVRVEDVSARQFPDLGFVRLEVIDANRACRLREGGCAGSRGRGRGEMAGQRWCCAIGFCPSICGRGEA